MSFNQEEGGSQSTSHAGALRHWGMLAGWLAGGVHGGIGAWRKAHKRYKRSNNRFVQKPNPNIWALGAGICIFSKLCYSQFLKADTFSKKLRRSITNSKNWGVLLWRGIGGMEQIFDAFSPNICCARMWENVIWKLFKQSILAGAVVGESRHVAIAMPFIKYWMHFPR